MSSNSIQSIIPSSTTNENYPKQPNINASFTNRNTIGFSIKLEVFLSSFFAYTSVHALRTTYSSSKSYFPGEIGIDEKVIGIVDSVMLLFIGVGNFMIAMRPLSKPIRALWIALFVCSLQYTLVPISMNLMSGPGAFAVLVILMGISGFIQSFMWPNLLPLVHTVCSPDHDSILLGFWTTASNIGNIMGFLICQYLVLENDLGWETSMYIVSVYMLINALYIGVRIKQMPTQPQIQQRGQQNSQRQSLLSEQNSQKSIQSQLESPSIIKVFMNSPKVTFLTISFSLIKSINYGILLWLPVYFYTIGLVEYSLYIPMTYDVASIVGSTLLGVIFKVLSPSKKNIALLPVLFFLIIFFLLLKVVDFSIAGYFLFIGLVGLSLGGVYNTMAGLVTMQLVRSIPFHLQSKYLRFYSALLMAIGNIITALTQVIISFTVGQSEGKLFGIFMVYTAITLCTMTIAVIIEFYENRKKQQKGKQIQITDFK